MHEILEDYFCHNTKCPNHILCNSNMEVLRIPVIHQNYRMNDTKFIIKEIKRHELRNALGEFFGYFCDDCIKRME